MPKDINRVRDLEALAKNAKTEKDLFVVAYHFAQEGFTQKAVSCLNKIPINYFTKGLYRDLWFAMLAWSVYKNNNPREELRKSAEFFIVVQRAIPLFKHLKFHGFPIFMEFYDDYTNVVKFTNGFPPNKID